MKESEKIGIKCEKLYIQLCECMKESGWKGRYLGWCGDSFRKLRVCKLNQFEQQRLEHVQETRRNLKEKQAIQP